MAVDEHTQRFVTVVECFEAKEVFVAVVVSELDFVIRYRAEFPPAALRAHQLKNCCFADSRKCFRERCGSDEVPAWLLWIEAFVSVARMLANDPEYRVIPQLHEAPKCRSNAVPERMSEGTDLLHAALRISRGQFELLLQEKQTAGAEICFRFDLLVAD
jgi:hypothetical protein